MSDLRKQSHRVAVVLHVGELHVADQLSPMVRAQELTAVPIRFVQPPDGLYHLSVMCKRPPLSNRSLVVDCCDSVEEMIVEVCDSNLDTSSSGPCDSLSRSFVDLLVKPIPVAPDWKDGDWFRLSIEGIPWLWFRRSRPEGKQVWVQRRALECLDKSCQVIDILIPFILDPNGLNQPTTVKS